MDNSPLKGILELLDPPKGFEPWHGGLTLMGSLRGVDHHQAAWKPAPDRHNIWELGLHIAYWKYRVYCYINPRKNQQFERTPANWPTIEHYDAVNWRKDKLLIKQQHEQLLKEIRMFSEEQLEEYCSDKRTWTFRQLIEGSAAHDTYHIGQIQLMKRLYVSIEGK